MAQPAAVEGYTYGSSEAARSPVSDDEFARLRETVLFTPDDERYLRMAAEVLKDQVEDVLDLWYGFVGSHAHLVHYFAGPDGQPDARYLDRVRARFARWILDTCERPYDREWLDYQEEIALRHHRTKKNQTDAVDSVDQIHARYLIAFIYPITATMKDFLARKGHSADEVDNMHQAWFKAVTLQVALWCRPYFREGDW
jgi:hypothetical protein